MLAEGLKYAYIRMRNGRFVVQFFSFRSCRAFVFFNRDSNKKRTNITPAKTVPSAYPLYKKSNLRYGFLRATIY